MIISGHVTLNQKVSNEFLEVFISNLATLLLGILFIRFDVKYKFDIEVGSNGHHEFFGERGWTLRWSNKFKGDLISKPSKFDFHLNTCGKY